MYRPETKLKLKKPRSKPAKNGQEEEVFPYDEVIVIGVSPVSHASKGEYEGAEATGVIVKPLTGFGGVLDEPFGKLRQLYDVTYTPTEPPQAVTVFQETTTRPVLTSPEEQFAEQAPPGVKKSPTRVKTPHESNSPLGDVKPEGSGSPLDE